MASAKREWDDSDLQTQSYKKSKSLPLTSSNSLGLWSPPVTPEKKDRIIDLKVDVSTKTLFKRVNSPYVKAKALFLRGSKPHSSVLCAREPEANLIKGKIETCLTNMESNSIYVSGPPGTGKTAQVNAILDEFICSNGENTDPQSNLYAYTTKDGDQRTFRVIKINCMTITTPQHLFNHIYQQIAGIPKAKATSTDIEQLLSAKNGCILNIIVLDEMDNIINKSQQSLFELFFWASNVSSKKLNLLLIGIANALDLTDRFLPRLRSNCIDPTIVRFLPYSADQIKQVMTNKLLGLFEEETGSATNVPPMVQPAALMYCAKKSAVITGDLRKAFDIMYKALDVFEETTLQKYSAAQLNEMEFSKLPKLSISQVVKVCTMAFTIDYQTKLGQLNFQQRIILAFLFKFEEREQLNIAENTKANIKYKNFASINSFFEYYNNRMKSFDKIFSILKRGEFQEVISSLETQAFVNLVYVNRSSLSNQKFTMKHTANQALNFGSFKISTNIPKVEFLKSTEDVEILNKIVTSDC